MTEKEINELKERVNRITGLVNQIKAEMDSNIISVSVSNLGRASDIHISQEFDLEFDRWDSSLYKKAFSNYREVEFDEASNELATFIDGVKVFMLADKDGNNG